MSNGDIHCGILYNATMSLIVCGTLKWLRNHIIFNFVRYGMGIAFKKFSSPHSSTFRWLQILLVQTMLLLIVVMNLDDQTFRYFYNTDFLYLPSIYIDVFEHQGTPWNWALTPAPYFFPDMLVYFILYPIFKNAGLVAIIYASLQLWVIEILFYKIVECIYQNKKGFSLMLGSVVLINLYFWIVIFNKDEIKISHFLFTNSCHIGSTVSFLLSTLLIIKYIEYKKIIYLIFLFFTIVIATASDKLFVLQFILPAMLFLLLGVRNKKYPMLLLVITTAGAGGWLLIKLLSQYVFDIPPSTPPDFVSNSIRNFFATMRFYTNPLLFAAGIFLIHFISIIFTGISVFRITSEKRGWVLMLFLSGLFSFAGPVLLGYYIGHSCIRYLMHSYILLLLLLPFSISVVFKKGPITNYIPPLFSLYTVIILAVFLVRFDKKGLHNFFYFESPIITLIEKNENTLKNGVANYWTTKEIYILGNKNIRISAIQNNFEAETWQANKDWYLGNQHYPPPIYNFSIDIRPIPSLGPPIDSLYCKGHTIYRVNDFIFKRNANGKIEPVLYPN